MGLLCGIAQKEAYAVRILEEMVREGAWISEDLLEMFRRKMIQAREE